MTQKYEATVSPYAGLKSTCRHITSQDVGSDKIRFVVGTSIVPVSGKSNQLQIIKYDNIHASIQCVQTLEHPGEVWWIQCHPKEADLLFTISQTCSPSGNALSTDFETKMFRLPAEDPLGEKQTMEEVTKLAFTDAARRVLFCPSNSQKVVVGGANSFSMFDIERPETPTVSIASDDPILAVAVDPLHENVIAGCVGNSIKLWDVSSNEVIHEIAGAHSPNTLDVSFNENKAWWIATGGSDGFVRCWDARVGKAACEFRASSHWVTRVVPSVSHEQLILTTGTDSKVRVFNASQFAFQNEGKLKDGEIVKSIRHDDSVYCATWAATDPWVFASVSYKGQVNVCQLPSEIVESILMGDDSD